MNKRQTKVLKAAALTVALMLVFPPFVAVHKKVGIVESGYGFIVTGIESGKSYISATINSEQLLVQWVGVLIITGIFYLLNRD